MVTIDSPVKERRCSSLGEDLSAPVILRRLNRKLGRKKITRHLRFDIYLQVDGTIQLR